MPEDGQADRENRPDEEQPPSHPSDSSTPDMPEPDDPNSDPDRRWKRQLKTGARVGAGVAVVLGVGLVAVGLGGRAYVQRKLLPQVEAEMETVLQRDVTLGDVRFVWPWKVTIGASEIEELATVRSIDVRANLWTLLWRRELAIALRLNQPDVTLAQTEEDGWEGLALNVSGTGGGLPVAEIALEIANGQLELVPADGEAVRFERWQGRLQVPVDSGEATWSTQARSGDGRVDVEGTASFSTEGSSGGSDPRVELDIQTDDMSVTALNLLPITSIFRAQSGTADVNLQATWQANQPLDFQGEAIADGMSFAIAPVPQTFEEFNGRVELAPGMATLHGVEGRYGQIPLTASGTVEWDDPIYLQDWTPFTRARFNIAGSNSELTLTQLQDTFGLEFPVPVTGVVQGSATLTGIVTDPLLQGSFSEVAPATVSQLEIGTYSGNFALRGGQVNLTNLAGRLTNGDGRFTGSGRVNVAQSPVWAEFQFALSDADVNGIVAAYQFDPLPQSLGAIDAQGTAVITGSRPVITADWQASGGDIEGNGTFDWRDDTATIPQADLVLGDGTAAFSAVLTPSAADGGRAFSARAIPQSVPLGLFVPNVTGRLNGDIQIDGTTRDLSLAGLDASGQVELPDGIDRLPGPITAQVAWDGTGLTVTDGLVLNTVSVNGRIPVDIANQQIGTLALELSARQLPLESLPQLPESFPVSGLVNLDGQLSGRLDSLTLTGQLGLVNLQAAGLDFAPLQGPLQWQPDSAGVEIDLVSAAGNGGDRLAISLDRAFAPQSFLLQQGETSASGQREGDRFDIQLAQFPLALLNGIVPGVWNGTIDSELAVNLVDVTAVGSVTTYSPSWQGIQADRLQGSFVYGAGRLSISEGELQLQDSLYRANGSVWLPSGPQRQIRAGRSQEVAGDPLRLDVRLSTDNGSVEGLLRAVRWRDWSDVTTGLPNPQFGPASELEVAALDVLPRSLFDRLEAYSAIVVQQTELLDRQVDPRIPALSNLTGEFSGDLQVVGAITAPTVTFDMTGRNWTLTNPENPAQSYSLDRLATRGQYRETMLNLEALEAESGDRRGSLSGTFGNENQAGMLQLTRFPIELVSDFFPDAPRVTGDLNTTADIGGTLQNPMASGQFDLAALAINGNQLDAANGVFDYNQATLLLDGSIRSSSPNPVVVSGALPFPLPFATAVPPSDAIALELSARNEQLALLNVFTDAIAWESGEGLLDITIGGTLQNPTLDGGLTVTDGVVKLSTLPDPLQQLDASIDFDFNRINVQSFSGTFGEGTIEAAGLLAVNPEGQLQPNDTPLSVQIDDLQMDLPDLYRGEVDGEVGVGGTVLAPELSGGVRLTNGTISIPSASNGSGTTSQWQPRFKQLELTLGDNVQVVRQPLFVFTTEGTLILNGTLSRLRPLGTIRIARGNVNLGVANLRIDRGRDNTVVFDQQGGLDPLLNVAAFTEVSERLGGGTVSSDTFTSSDSDAAADLAEQRTIQVIATIQGRASELTSGRGTNSVELSSRPTRSPDQILALLGGAALDGVGSGNLAGFALSTVLFGAQNALGNAIGLDELRIAPFTGESGSLEVGVEAAKDLGAGVSVSVQQSLNDPDVNPRVNSRFRLGENILIRTGTDFEGDNQASFEFSTDF
ncbi:MAG: translocation/assembly module TamB domain-containing protein [Cyanobacteria bacterium P01_E01_bin.45]